jgi:rhodanese-related sulfurtransferase
VTGPRRGAQGHDGTPPTGPNARRSPRVERALLLGAVVAGGLAAIAGAPTRPVHGTVDVRRLAEIVEMEEDHVTAVELAAWIRDDHTGLRILDIRPDSEFRELHIPGATNVQLPEIAHMPIDSTATYVLYSEGGTHAAQGWFLLQARGVENVYFLRGGLYEWLEQVMNPRLDANASQAERDSVLALTRWFGGTVQVGSPPNVAPSVLDDALTPPTKATTREPIRKIRRRAC